MPTEKKILLYEFDELLEKAKEKARSWWRESVFSELHDWECVYEDATECAKCMGITFGTRPIPLMGGRTRSEVSIFFSGFSSQGDGACFEGEYQYIEKAGEKIREHAPLDKELHRIADHLDEIQNAQGNMVTARMKHTGHYCHSGCMDVTVFCDNEEVYDELQKEVTEVMRDFADWIYKQLRNEYDFQMKDETVDENIRCNEYTFTVDGKREDL